MSNTATYEDFYQVPDLSFDISTEHFYWKYGFQ